MASLALGTTRDNTSELMEQVKRDVEVIWEHWRRESEKRGCEFDMPQWDDDEVSQ